VFIESLEFDPVLFEKGDISFDPTIALDDSCYREAEAADIFVLIIGGRYRSAASKETTPDKDAFFEEYNSITRQEFNAAHAAGVPTFTLVDSAVHAEYDTYKINKEKEGIKYAHVDSVNVFKLLEDIYSKARNNVVLKFERATDITTWLREQWAGLFKELLKSKSRSAQLGDLNARAGELKSVNETLRSYMEDLLGSAEPNKSTAIIEDQKKARLFKTSRGDKG